MRSSEDFSEDMPMNRNYDAKVSNEVFIPDTEIPSGETDPFDVDSAIEKDGSKDSMMDRNMTNEIGSTGAEDELTATLDAAMRKKRGLFHESEERVVDMNIEGMPWFHDELEEEEIRRRQNVPELNRRETRRVIFSAMLASLMVAGVFILGMFLFILFCTKVWF